MCDENKMSTVYFIEWKRETESSRELTKKKYLPEFKIGIPISYVFVQILL
jgi:hypothetical protein